MTIRGQRIDIFNSTGFSVWPSCLLWCLCQSVSVCLLSPLIYPPLLPVLRRLLWLERWLRMQASEYGGESRRWFRSISISIGDLGYKGNACKWSQKINNATKISSHAVINKHWWREVSIKQIFKTINGASFNHTFWQIFPCINASYCKKSLILGGLLHLAWKELVYVTPGISESAKPLKMTFCTLLDKSVNLGTKKLAFIKKVNIQ